jgi:hypothetical protein
MQWSEAARDIHWEWLDALAGDVDEDFASAVREQPEGAERPGLGKVFR